MPSKQAHGLGHVHAPEEGVEEHLGTLRGMVLLASEKKMEKGCFGSISTNGWLRNGCNRTHKVVIFDNTSISW